MDLVCGRTSRMLPPHDRTRPGVFWIMWRAGVVSAAPVQLMSDHVFLGSSLAAVLGAEAVLIRLHIARRSGAAAPHLHPAEHPLLWAGAASSSLHIHGTPVFSVRSALPCTFT